MKQLGINLATAIFLCSLFVVCAHSMDKDEKKLFFSSLNKCMQLLGIPKTVKTMEQENVERKAEYEELLKKKSLCELWRKGTLEIKKMPINDTPLTEEELKLIDISNIKLFQLNCCGTLLFTSEVFTDKCNCAQQIKDARGCKIYIEVGSEFRLIKECVADKYYWDNVTLFANRKQPYSFGEEGLEHHLTDSNRIGVPQGDINYQELAKTLNDISIYPYEQEIQLSIDHSKRIGIGLSERSLFVCSLQPFEILRVLHQINLEEPFEEIIVTREETCPAALLFIQKDPKSAKELGLEEKYVSREIQGPLYYGEHNAVMMDAEGTSAQVITLKEGVFKCIPHWSFLGPQENFKKIMYIDFDFNFIYNR